MSLQVSVQGNASNERVSTRESKNSAALPWRVSRIAVSRLSRMPLLSIASSSERSERVRSRRFEAAPRTELLAEEDLLARKLLWTEE